MFMEDKMKKKIPESMSGQEGLDFLMDYILGEDYYIVDPVSNKQGNSIVVADIIEYCENKDKNIRKIGWMFVVCFSVLMIRGILDVLSYIF